MDVIKIFGVAFISIILIIIVEKYSKEQAMFIRIACGIIIVTLIIFKISDVSSSISSFKNLIQVDDKYIMILFKIISISYLIEFTSEIAKDAGENAIASNIVLAGKIIVMYISSPILVNLLEITNQMIQ